MGHSQQLLAGEEAESIWNQVAVLAAKEEDWRLVFLVGQTHSFLGCPKTRRPPLNPSTCLLAGGLSKHQRTQQSHGTVVLHPRF